MNTIEKVLESKGVILYKHRRVYSFFCKRCGEWSYTTENPRNYGKGPYCNTSCSSFKHGKTVNGYILYKRSKEGPKTLHRIFYERMIGRKLGRDEVVHHIDGDKTNNNMCNLQLMTRQEHSRLHTSQRYNKETK